MARVKTFTAGGSLFPGDLNSIQDDYDTRLAALEAAGVVAQAGDVKATARSTAPPGWLLCDGAPVSRTGATLALFNAIGTAYGVGDGTTTFNLPDLRGRVPVGVDGAAGRMAANDALGNSAGTETHTLLVAEMPSHRHTIQTILVAGGAGVSMTFQNNSSTTQVQDAGMNGPLIANTGGGLPHNNLQPYQVVNWLVKT